MTMPRTKYLAALRRLRLGVASQETAELFGLTVRQCMRYAHGYSRVRGPLEKLIEKLLEEEDKRR